MNASIEGGIITLEDGTQVNLIELQATCNYAFQELGYNEFAHVADQLSKLTGVWQGPQGDWFKNEDRT